MKKTLFAILLAGIVMLPWLGGCTSSVNIIHGAGSVVSRDFDVANFTAITIGGSHEVIYRQSENSSVTVTMHENLFEHLEVEVQGNTLRVGFARGVGINMGSGVSRVYVYTPYLNEATLSGSVRAVDWDAIYADSFTIAISGSGSGNFHGNVDSFNATISGSGRVLAEELQTKDASIRVSGSGNVAIAVSDNLDVNISGSGRVNYIGNPAVTSSISGSGRINRID